ncbi:zinc finger and SCAN domain-containing protein 31-like [Anopheles darlingi]|uniref:zinc finger and SCAN domain-containing protein 31-like n=1 Tax=Anopheles darlingi TaxID=43151 RepID=UPI0021004F80|nr:zinc finger and SCAN domain-containing protein 31-like [Anopheles darlingi]
MALTVEPGPIALENAATALHPEWGSICRVCLRENDELYSLFDQLQEPGQFSYAEIIMQFSNMIISEEDNLPSQICDGCINELMAAYRFCLKCDNTNEILQSYLTDVPQDAAKQQTPEQDHAGGISVQLNSGVSYTYKPPNGLDVTVIPRREPQGKEVLAQTAAGKFDFLSDKDESEAETVEYIYERTSDVQGDANLSELPEVGSSDEVEQDSSVDTTEPHATSYCDPMRTIQSIRKSNRPNESKPTIDTVTIQPAADGSGFETVIRLKRNLSIAKPMHSCKICNKTYKYKHVLETHLRRHRGERPYKCEHCDKAFVVPFELRRHVRIHTGQKPYNCQFCERSYSDFSCKVKHERTHTGERPYRCQYCRKSFAYSHVLNNHILIHTGMNKYTCSICGKHYSKSDHLKAHMNIHLAGGASTNKKDPKVMSSGAPPTVSESCSSLDGMLGKCSGAATPNKPSNETSTVVLLDTSEPLLVESYVDASQLGTWTTVCSDSLAEIETANPPTVVTIGGEELGNVSIVNLSDYMMKNDELEELIEESSVQLAIT